MNRDFRKLNPDTADVITEFEDIAADSEIEFRLAQIDPAVIAIPASTASCHL